MNINLVDYLDLDELKETLDKKKIKYRYYDADSHPFITGPVIYVSALDQLDKPTKKQKEAFVPYIRVTCHAGDAGYYVRDTGMILEDVSLEELIPMIKSRVEEGKKYL